MLIGTLGGSHYPDPQTLGRGVLPENLGWGVRRVSGNPYPISDQNMWFSLPYFGSGPNFDTLFQTRSYSCEVLNCKLRKTAESCWLNEYCVVALTDQCPSPFPVNLIHCFVTRLSRGFLPCVLLVFGMTALITALMRYEKCRSLSIPCQKLEFCFFTYSLN